MEAQEEPAQEVCRSMLFLASSTALMASVVGARAGMARYRPRFCNQHTNSSKVEIATLNPDAPAASRTVSRRPLGPRPWRRT
eukprot:2521693-Pyramimonas_sp.AAC.1